jgi:hypothetical protein
MMAGWLSLPGHHRFEEDVMYTKRKFTRWSGGILAVWLLISSCGIFNFTAVGETVSETQTVELGSASEVEVQVQIGAGELSIAGGSEALMDATFRYNVADWQPRVNYTVSGSQGELVVGHQDTEPSIPAGDAVVNDWNLLFNNDVPIDLEIQTGAGACELDLHTLDLTGLLIEVGAGNTTIDLSGDLEHDLNATIHGGVGQLSVMLPGEMGVRVSADTGLGGLTNSGLRREGEYYVNEAYGSAPNTLFLDISAGVGAINLIAP